MITAGLFKGSVMERIVASYFLLYIKLPALFRSKIFPNIKEVFHFTAACLNPLLLGFFLSNRYKKASKIRKKSQTQKHEGHSNDTGKYIQCHYEPHMRFLLNCTLSKLQRSNSKNKDIKKNT